jgi:uncharacterized protein
VTEQFRPLVGELPLPHKGGEGRGEGGGPQRTDSRNAPLIPAFSPTEVGFTRLRHFKSNRNRQQPISIGGEKEQAAANGKAEFVTRSTAGDDRLSDDISRERRPGAHADRRFAIAAGAAEIPVAGVALAADLAGALYWPEEQLLVVSDLHLEKGSSFARRGVLLPPYDTASTLDRLAAVLSRYTVRTVIALGDSFHDQNGPARLAAADRAKLMELRRGRDWIWIAGNHDPDPPHDLGGVCATSLSLWPLSFRHEPTQQASPGEIAGHLHPVARVGGRSRTVTRRCFVSDGARLVMPAFGAYAGGLNIRHAAFAQAFGALAFTAHLLGQRRLFAFAAIRCLADGSP